MIESSNISIGIIGFVVIVIIFWVKSNSKAIDKYNNDREIKLKTEYEKHVPDLKAKGYSDKEINNMYQILKTRINDDSISPEVKDINHMVTDPMGFLKQKFN